MSSTKGQKKKKEQQLKFSNELIEDWAIAVGMTGDRPWAFDTWTAPVWLEVRDEIEEKGLVNDEVREIDKFAIEFAFDWAKSGIYPYIPWYGRENKPLEKWWWYFHEIAKGEYPIELLPDYLQEVVKKFRR